MEWTRNRVYEDNPKSVFKSTQWKVRLFSRKNCFQLSFSRDYDENALYIALQLPWLLFICFSADVARYWLNPRRLVAGALCYSLTLNREMYHAEWNRLDTMDSDTSTGHHWVKSWEDVWRGDQLPDVEVSDYGITDHIRRVRFYGDESPGPILVGCHFPTSDGCTGSVQLYVGKYQYTAHYKRWWVPAKRWTRYDVTCSNPNLKYPGKGENGWDCGDETLTEISFGSHCESPEQAADLFIQHYHKLCGYNNQA